MKISKLKEKFENAGKNIIDETKTEIYGNRELVLTGFVKIEECDKCKAVLTALKEKVEISGDGLELILLAEHIIAVKGKIRSVEFLQK